MGGKIFSDSDHRFPMVRRKDGAVVQCTCPFCEMEFAVKHSWQEVRMMLQGQPVPGIQNTAEGWTTAAECPNGQCGQRVRYGIDQDELERVADQQLAAQQRLANAGR
jgi:hypothetical protein